jgi:outer membrane lipoprotein carrier protein
MKTVTTRMHWIIAMTAFLSFAAAAGEKTAKDIIEKVQSKYDDMDDIVLTFSQNVRFKVSKAEQQIDGVLYFKKKNKYRIETEQRLIVTDGKTSWSYNPQKNQVVIDQYKENSGSFSPDQILLRSPKDYYAALVKEDKAGGEACYLLKLTPKEENAAVKSLRIWVSRAWLIRKAEITDLNGAVTTYLVKDVAIDKGIPDTKFEFPVPKNAETIDLR